jgi:hypothetical protein
MIGEIYVKYSAEPRFASTSAGKSVIVTPSDAFLKEISETLHAVE